MTIKWDQFKFSVYDISEDQQVVLLAPSLPVSVGENCYILMGLARNSIVVEDNWLKHYPVSIHEIFNKSLPKQVMDITRWGDINLELIDDECTPSWCWIQASFVDSDTHIAYDLANWHSLDRVGA